MPNIPNITTHVDFRKGNLFGDCTITLSLSAENNSENQNNNETPTGIRQTDRVATPNGPMYDLQGRRISAPVRGQIYIQGGEKRLNLN